MRRVRYNVAATLDGYIAGPNGEYDWIPEDPTVDFAAIFAKVDTVLVGRRSYEACREMIGGPGQRVYVFSRTLRPEDCPGATLVSEDAAGVVSSLRHEEGDGEIWLFGGGELFRTLLEAGQVDTVEVTIVPVLLGGGVPLLPGAAAKTLLKLERTHTYPSGMVSLIYSVPGAER